MARPSERPPPAMPWGNDLPKLLAAAALPPLPGAPRVIEVRHDGWCDQVARRGLGNCDPIIRIPDPGARAATETASVPPVSAAGAPEAATPANIPTVALDAPDAPPEATATPAAAPPAVPAWTAKSLGAVLKTAAP